LFSTSQLGRFFNYPFHIGILISSFSLLTSHFPPPNRGFLSSFSKSSNVIKAWYESSNEWLE
jgi:hypothetical protein